MDGKVSAASRGYFFPGTGLGNRGRSELEKQNVNPLGEVQ